MMKHLSWLGNTLAAAAIIYFLYLAGTTPGVLDRLSMDSAIVGALVGGIVIYVAALGVGSSIWFLLLRSIGAEVAWHRALSIVWISQAAKYLPGNFAHHVGRVVLAKRQGIGAVQAVFAMFLEFAWSIGIGALLALIYLLSSGSHWSDYPALSQPWWALAALVGVAAIAPALGHRLFDFAVAWWSRRRNIEPDSLNTPAPLLLSLAGGLSVANFVVFGLLMLFLAGSVYGSTEGSILALTGIFAVAWVVGFLAPGAPAGLGIREVLLATGLTPLYGAEVAIGMAALLRVISVLGDGVALATGLMLSGRGTTE
jgi:uncharacterized membrane protein YbhN (UPF0104 family)